MMAEYLRATLLDWRVAVPLAGAIVTALVIWAPKGGHPPGGRPPETARHEAPGPFPETRNDDDRRQLLDGSGNVL